MKNKSFKKIIFILITFSFFPVIISMESFAYTCNITNPEDTGCCGTCSGWFDFCWPTAVLGDPPTKCNTPEGTCICNEVAWCNSAVIRSCVDPLSLTPGEVHQCDDCCCNLGGGGNPPGGDDDDPEPNIWYGVLGQVWSDFNSNGVRENNEIWKGAPYYGTIVNGVPARDDCEDFGGPVRDFSVTVNGENIARAWWCQPGNPQIYYFSHYQYRPGWEGLNADMTKGGYYTATLGNVPSGSSCGTWSVYNPGSFQESGTGCDASFLFTTVNDYMRIDWKLVASVPATTVTTDCISPSGPISSLTQNLRWDATTNADRYQYQYRLSSGTSATDWSAILSPIPDTSLTAPNVLLQALPSGSGAWQARAVFPDNSTTAWSRCFFNYTPPNPIPVGYFDGAECGSEPGPNFHKIRAWGWACDPSNYSSPINVDLYNGTSGSGTFVGRGLANINGWAAIGSYCGGTTSHVFEIYSSTTFPSGTYTFNAYGINTPPGTNPLLGGSPKSVSCCAPTNGTLGPWGACSGGSQTSPCNGFSCGGSCSAECGTAGGSYDSNTNICTRPCLRIDGNIWSDDDLNGKTISDHWKGDNSLTCTDKLYREFYMNISGEPSTNQIVNWWCHSSGYGSYYNTPVPNTIEPESTKTFTLSNLPLNYKCDNWNFIYRKDGVTTSQSGPGCAASNLPMPSYADWVNVNWETYKCEAIWTDTTTCNTLCGPGKLIRTCGWSDPRCTGSPSCNELDPETDCNQNNVCHYVFDPVVREIPPIQDPGDFVCPGSLGGYDLSSSAAVTVVGIDPDGAPGSFIVTEYTNISGKLINPINVPYNYPRIGISVIKNTGGDAPESFTLECPGNNTYTYPEESEVPLPYLPSDTIPADGNYPSLPIDLGILPSYKGGWVSAIDSDIFANLLNVVVPQGPTDNSDLGQTPQGFAKTLINSSSNSDNYLGFIFSESGDKSNPDVDRGCPNKKGFETIGSCDESLDLGGYSYDLIASGIEHDSKWLKNFTFTPPSGAIQLSSIGNSFKANTVYKIAQDDYSTIELPGTYSITDGTGVSILYFEGNLVIRENFTTNSNGRLLLIVNGAVTITKDVGIDLSTLPANSTDFVMSENPHIMAGIIASGNIYFQSVGGSIKDNNRDKAIMVSAPLISKTSISFGRDLYHDNNATIPAESAKAFNKYLYLLSSLEREKSQENLYFTGLTTYDLDWEYIY